MTSGRPNRLVSILTTLTTLGMIFLLPLLIAEELQQSPEGAQAAEHLTTAISQVLSTVVLVASVTAKAVGLAMVLYWGYTVLQTAVSSPYSVKSVGVHGRALPVEAIDLGDHDDAECLTCGREEGLGVRRGYVNEHVVFGLPVLEKTREETYDCDAHTDRKGLDALDQDDRDALDLALEQSGDETDEDSTEEKIGEEAGDAR